MLHLVDRFKIADVNAHLAVLICCSAKFQFHARMIGCLQPSSRFENRHHGFLSHVLISQLSISKFIVGLLFLLKLAHYFEF